MVSVRLLGACTVLDLKSRQIAQDNPQPDVCCAEDAEQYMDVWKAPAKGKEGKAGIKSQGAPPGKQSNYSALCRVGAMKPAPANGMASHAPLS